MTRDMTIADLQTLLELRDTPPYVFYRETLNVVAPRGRPVRVVEATTVLTGLGDATMALADVIWALEQPDDADWPPNDQMVVPKTGLHASPGNVEVIYKSDLTRHPSYLARLDAVEAERAEADRLEREDVETRAAIEEATRAYEAERAEQDRLYAAQHEARRAAREAEYGTALAEVAATERAQHKEIWGGLRPGPQKKKTETAQPERTAAS